MRLIIFPPKSIIFSSFSLFAPQSVLNFGQQTLLRTSFACAYTVMPIVLLLLFSSHTFIRWSERKCGTRKSIALHQLIGRPFPQLLMITLVPNRISVTFNLKRILHLFWLLHKCPPLAIVLTDTGGDDCLIGQTSD